MLNKKMKSAASFTPIRFGLLCVAILGCLGLLLARVGWLQIVSPDNLVKQEDMRSLREEPVAVERGMITDREGRPLAVSVPVSAIWIDPQTTMEKGGVGYGPRWQAMAEALHLNLGELAQRVQSHPHARFLYLARQINPEQAEWIDKLHLPGVYLRDESRRFYPAGHVAANLLGFTNVDNQGIEGVEKSFNAQLTGKPGRRLVRKDKHGNVIENITEVPPVPAHNLQLSIDERLQTVTEDALDNAVRWNKAESGAAVLIKIDTGEILAMASYPDFNPNNRDAATLDDFRNRVLGLTGESAGLMPHRRYWGQLDRATFAFGYGLMVTPLQLAHVYATIGGFGIERPLSITRIDPPVIGTRVMPENIVHSVEHMMESVALPGGGGTKAAVRDYRVAVKTGTAKKIGPDGKYIDKYVAYTAGVAPASRPQFALVVVMNDPSNGSYYGGAVSAPVFSQIMGDVLRLENVMPDGMPQGAENLIVMHDSHPQGPAL